MNLNDLEHAALSLPEEERWSLLERIMDSLDPGDPGITPEAWEQAWGDEVERRLQEIDAGKATLVPADEVIRRARAALRQ